MVIPVIVALFWILTLASTSTSDPAPRSSVPQTVAIVHDGSVSEVPYSPGTVGQTILRCGIELGPHDIVKPDRGAQAVAGRQIVIVRVKHVTVTAEEKLRPRHFVKQSSRMPRRLASIVSRGQPGRIERTYSLTCHDGEVVDQTVICETILEEPTPTVVATGGKALPSRGFYAGRRSFEMEATAYSAQQKGIKNTTAGGYRTGKGVVAVDPHFIPLKTRLYIEGYGEAIAGDTGGAIKGNRIDLGFDTLREAINFGRRKVTVHVLD